MSTKNFFVSRRSTRPRKLITPSTFGWWEAVTNIAYPVAAWLITGDPFFTVLMGLLGVGSAYYHAGGKDGSHFDVAAIFAVLFFTIGTMWIVPPEFALPGSIAAGAALRRFTLDIPMEQKIGTLVVLILLFGFISGANLLPAMGVLTAALALRQWVDHGVWHLVSAPGLALLHHAIQIASK